jgi:hypothetical protein
MADRWEMTEATAAGNDIKGLLAAGWEPYAVVAHDQSSVGTVHYFKRRARPKPMYADRDCPDCEENDCGRPDGPSRLTNCGHTACAYCGQPK